MQVVLNKASSVLAIAKNTKTNFLRRSCCRPMTSQSHYEAHTAQSYENAFFYEEGAYTQRLCDLVAEGLQLNNNKQDVGDTSNSKRTLLDIGGGTGNFTKMLIQASDHCLNAIVVDPFLEASSNSDGDEIHFVKAAAEDYMKPFYTSDNNHSDNNHQWRQGYHQVLLKEVVHHFDDQHRPAIFKGIYEGLNPNNIDMPSLLIITRPQRDHDYPLWPAAREVFAQHQPHVDDLTRDLQQAGFQRVSFSVEAYPCEILLERWQSMVQQRFWSTFAHFSNDELEAACRIIAQEQKEQGRIDQNGLLHFEDRLLFIEAYK